MATQPVIELKKKSDAAWANLSRQASGMDAHLDRADAPGEWTLREVLCHLMFEPEFEPRAVLSSFAHRDLPVFDVKAGDTHVTPDRERMSLDEIMQYLDRQRHALFAYLGELDDAELGRKARIPLFKQFMGTDEIPIPMFVGAMFDFHWNDHAGQIAKIRRAVGLPEAK
jgi:hypothetical protein